MQKRRYALLIIVSLVLISLSSPCRALTWSPLGAEQVIQAGDPPADITLHGYSVPSYADWNNDGKKDLIIGAEHVEVTPTGLVESGKVYVYLNEGSSNEPIFNQSFFAQSSGADLACPIAGCMSCFPRVVYWDDDGRKDLLLGQSDGRIKLFLNINTDASPAFDGGQYLQVGPEGAKQDISVGWRATTSVVDWNSDGKKDIVSGALDGRIHLFINEGTDTEPNFLQETFAQENGSNLVVPTQRSSPCVLDVDGDGKKDLLTGNTEGQVLLYLNTGTDASPAFSGYTLVEANGTAINLAGTPRSRLSVCDWTGDGYLDILVGAGTAKVHLFEGLVFAGDLEPDGDVDIVDFAIFASWWMHPDCASYPDCQNADLAGDDNIIQTDDLLLLVENWLEGRL